MRELLEMIAKNLVDDPSQVFVSQRVKEDEENIIILELRVSQEDMGKIIGKQGKIAKAIRSVIKAAAVHNNKKVLVEIVQ